MLHMLHGIFKWRRGPLLLQISVGLQTGDGHCCASYCLYVCPGAYPEGRQHRCEFTQAITISQTAARSCQTVKTLIRLQPAFHLQQMYVSA